MISKSELKVKNPEQYQVKVRNRNVFCYECRSIKRILRGNSKDLLDQLKFNIPDCYCKKEATIDLLKKSKKTWKKIGWLNLVNLWKQRYPDTKRFETHSTLIASEQNKRLGLLMYSAAADWCFKHSFKLYSSNAPSEEAQRIWRSKTLRKYYQVKKNGRGRWYIRKKNNES